MTTQEQIDYMRALWSETHDFIAAISSEIDEYSGYEHLKGLICRIPDLLSALEEAGSLRHALSEATGAYERVKERYNVLKAESTEAYGRLKERCDFLIRSREPP